MLKLLLVLPILFFALLACAFGSVLILPLLGLGAAIFGIAALAIGIFALVLRLLAAVVLGVGGLLFGVLGFALVIGAGAVVLVLAGALVHLALPLLLIFAIIWLVRRASRPPPVAIGHG